jgi:thioredoxin 1
MVKEIVGKAEFEAEVLRSRVPVLVDFWSPLCGPCKAIAPTIEELAGSVQGAQVVKVNVDDNLDLAVEHRISGIPALLFFKDGREAARHVGTRSRQVLSAELDRLKR